MLKARLLLALIAAIAALCVQALSQTDPNSQPSMSETVREFDRMMSNSEQLRRSTLPSSKTPPSIRPVLVAIPEFRKATADLREAVSTQKNMRVPLQSLEKLIKPFAEYFKDLNLKPAAPDAQEFKGYSQKDLVWETLTTAERVDNNLQIANRLLIESNRSSEISIKAMQFFGGIDTDLKRLKLLADKVESPR